MTCELWDLDAKLWENNRICMYQEWDAKKSCQNKKKTQQTSDQIFNTTV